MRIPYPSAHDAEIVRRVLTVDKELRPTDVVKTWSISPLPLAVGEGAACQNAPSAAELTITIHALDTRSLRVSANALLEDVALVTRSIHAFHPDAMRTARNQGLEMGSVGRAG